MADPEALISQLDESTTAAREVLGDLRGELKEARRVLRDVQQEREQVEAMVRRAVDDEIAEHVREQVDALGEKTREAMDEAIAKVSRKFRQIENVLMTGKTHGRPSDGFDLRRLIEGDGHG